MHPVLFQLGSLIIPSYGVVAAVGVLFALGLAQWTARRCSLDPRHAWNLIVLALFASLAASRLLLILTNLSVLRQHPRWLLAVAMVHHPLLAGVGIVAAAVASIIYIRWAHLSFALVADCLAAPLCLGVAAEQFAALLAGSDYGAELIQSSRWTVLYTSPLAARWSGTPLGVPLYPVQAYAATGALLLSVVLVWALRRSRRSGDTAGIALLGLGVLFFITEIFRDWEGRGVLFGGFMDMPQLVALGLVLAGGLVLTQWRMTSRSASLASERSTHV